MPVTTLSPEADPMEMKSNQSSPVVTNSVPLSKTILGIHSSLLPYSQSGSPLSPDMCTPIPRRVHGKPEDPPTACAWLDAMKASSPPRKTMIMDYTSTPLKLPLDDPAEVAYTSWMLMHPSALKSFGKIAECAKNKKIAIFLDYDGTLAPIVNDPDRAFMSNTMRAAVRNVAKCFPTAIISGRSRDKVFDLVGLTDLYYAGSHGMDIIGPCTTGSTPHHHDYSKSSNHKDSNIILFQPAGEFLPMIDEVYRALVEKTKGISGAKVENHKFCASVHYRNVEEKNWAIVADSVDGVLKNYPLLRLTHGRKVLEIRPMIEWHKGKAVEFVLKSLGLGEGKDMISIYIGDDKTDEDAFKVLLEENRGFGVVVSSIPKETSASYSLRDPSEVMEFLNCLVRWGKELR